MSRKRKRHQVIESLEILSYAAEGKSLGKTEGKVIFVEGTIPGDVVDVRLSKNKKDWAEGTPVNFKKYSEQRIQPFCSHFLSCGGCQWQMLPYSQQLQYKQQQVADSMKRIGKVALPETLPIAGADKIKYYRNKIEYTFGNKQFIPREQLNDEHISNDKNVAGFHARGLFDKIVDIDTCYLQEEPTNTIRKYIKQLAVDHSLSFYDIRNHTGFMRNMQIRLCNTGELMVNIIFGENRKKDIELITQSVINRFPEITTLLYTINTKWNDSINDLTPVPVKGKGYVVEQLEEFKYKIGPQSFFQTNTLQAEKLYSITREFADLDGSQVVYDLYCGTGSIGIFLSKKAKKIIGVEVIATAIDDARENAALNGITDAHFFAGDVIDICTSDFFDTYGKPDVIVTDPPRAGMHQKLVEKLLEIKAPLIVYVSCNPATQARDIQLLSQDYEVTKMQAVDMFPHTLHIENVMQLKLKDNI